MSKMMHWYIQENVFKEDAYDTFINILEKYNLSFSIHKIIPFIGELTPEPNVIHKNAICFGSYSMRHFAKKHSLTPGVFDLEPFNFQIQLQHWGNEMLNADSIVTEFENARFTQDEMFIRPIEDSKVFAGHVMSKEKFDTWKKQVCVLKDDFGDNLNNNTLVQVTPLKKIYSEHRFWIVKGKIITASTYKTGRRVAYSEVIDDRYYNYTQERINEWQPHEAFVIDIADTEDGLKVVEINTINSCGFYKANLENLVVSLELHFRIEKLA